MSEESRFQNAKFDDVEQFVRLVERLDNKESLGSATEHKQTLRSVERLEVGLGLKERNEAAKTNSNQNDPPPDRLVMLSRGKSPTITPLGRQIYPEAERLLLLLKRWRRLCRQQRRGIEIRIGVRPLHWHWIVKPWCERIREKSDNKLSIDLVSDTQKNLRNMLFNTQLDLCLLYDDQGELPEYEKHIIGVQTLILAVNLPRNWSGENCLIDDVVSDPRFHYISVKRDTSYFARKHRQHHQDQPFFQIPHHRFTDSNFAWDYFQSEQGRGAVGYFSKRKLEQMPDTARVFDNFTIVRSLCLYTRTTKVLSAESVPKSVLKLIASGKFSDANIGAQVKNALRSEIANELKAATNLQS